MSLCSHSFIVQSVVLYLCDANVLTNLLIVCRSMIPMLGQYRLKQGVSPSFMIALYERPNLPSNNQTINQSISASVDIIVCSIDKVACLEDLKSIQNHHYSSYITHLSFAHSYNERIPVAAIPDSIIHLKFGVLFNQFLPVGVLPSSLTHLTTGLGYRKQLETNSIPSSVTHLTIKGPLLTIPSSVTCLVFGHEFNHVLPIGSIPSSVKRLTFGHAFNQTIFVGALPHSLTHLTFGYNFNQPLQVDVIPSSVKHLQFGWDFNQPLVIGAIPNGVTHLNFGNQFNQPLDPDVLPSSITHLIFGRRFNQTLSKGVIPSSVSHLMLGDEFNQTIKTTNNSKISETTELFNAQISPYQSNNQSINQSVSFIPDSITHLIVNIRPAAAVFGKGESQNAKKKTCVVS